MKKHFRRSAGIEPIIGHIKSDHRLGRNYYKGIIGDHVNLLLSAAAFNFKRMMNKWKSSFLAFFESFVKSLYEIFTLRLTSFNSKKIIFQA